MNSHLKIEGHSHNFWNLLHKFVPNYEDEIKWLELNSKIFYIPRVN
jgi:predicted metal-dependent hydrolase